MATLSLRQVAENCLGLTGDISVNTDVYGYPYREADGSLFGTLGGDDTLLGSGEATTRSLKRHLETVSGWATDLVVILVGHEEDFSGVVDLDDVTKVQYAIQEARDVFAQAGFGIRRIIWQRIPVLRAGGRAYIYDKAEATELTEEFSGPDGGIDVFFVQSIGDAGGWSNVSGPCDKDAKDERSGVVIELSRPRRSTGDLLAHEIGHYLGLIHTNMFTNIMGTDFDGNGVADINGTDMTTSQATRIRLHCSVHPPC